jgi:hypothetical protein
MVLSGDRRQSDPDVLRMFEEGELFDSTYGDDLLD